MVNKVDSSLQRRLFIYRVIGAVAFADNSPASSEVKKRNGKVYRLKVFAQNEVKAVSLFWGLMKKLHKVKRSQGVLLSCKRLAEQVKNSVKNYAFSMSYKSRTGVHRMYKEYRDVTEAGAVSQLYAEMAGRHRVKPFDVTVYRVNAIEDSECKRPQITQMHDPQLAFPVVRHIPLKHKRHKHVFSAKRPTTYVS